MTPAFVIVRSVLPDLIVPATVTFHSVRLTVAAVAAEAEGGAADVNGDAAGAALGSAVGDYAAGGA